MKPPLDPRKFERAFSVLDQYERAWWRVHECLGLRMDEGNRLLRTDPDFESGMIHVPGTKTEDAECYLPMSPALQTELKSYLASRTDDSPYLFPGRSAQTKGKKIYSHRRLFEKILRVTAYNAYMAEHPGTKPMAAWKALKAEKYPGGVKLTTKELRDYFATQVSAQVKDPKVVMNLMRHTSLNTTTLYTRTVDERMKQAVQNLGAGLGGRLGASPRHKNTRNDTMQKLILELAKTRSASVSSGEKSETPAKISGGRSRTRTYDLAHVRRAL